MLYLGADHRGFELKERIKEKLGRHNYFFEDLGYFEYEPSDDYTDIALKLAGKVVAVEDNRGLLVCGSGVGVNVAANKIKGARACLIDNPAIAKKAVEDDGVNILCLAADFTAENLAWEIIDIFLNTKFVDSEKHRRRIQKIKDYENHPIN